MVTKNLEFLAENIANTLDNNETINLISQISKKTNLLEEYFYGINNDSYRINNSVIDEITHHIGNSVLILSGSVRSFKKKINKEYNKKIQNNLDTITNQALSLENHLKKIKLFRKNYSNINKPTLDEKLITKKTKIKNNNDISTKYANYINNNLNNQEIITLMQYLIEKEDINNYFFGLNKEEKNAYGKIINESINEISKSIKTISNNLKQIKKDYIPEKKSNQNINGIIEQINRLNKHQIKLKQFYDNGYYSEEYDAPSFLKSTYNKHKKTNNGSSIDIKFNDNSLKCPIYIDQESLMISMQRIYSYLSNNNSKTDNELKFDIEKKNNINYFVAEIISKKLNIEKNLSECMNSNTPNPYNGLSKTYKDFKEQNAEFDITSNFPYGSKFKLCIPIKEGAKNNLYK
ncbi:MAG: hypothetical protein ACOC3X_00395 [Nanoarchaeota archaeon]